MAKTDSDPRVSSLLEQLPLYHLVGSLLLRSNWQPDTDPPQHTRYPIELYKQADVEALLTRLTTEARTDTYIDTYTPILWNFLSDEEKYAQYIRARRASSSVMVRQQEEQPSKCAIGKYCRKHGFIHGAEAEELRQRVETILDQVDHEVDDAASELDRALRIMLDDIDARDSVAFLDVRQQEPVPATPTKKSATRVEPSVSCVEPTGSTAETLPGVVIAAERTDEEPDVDPSWVPRVL